MIRFIKKILENRITLMILFILYLIISFILVLHHEIWTDEAQAWLIARDLSFLDIVKQMKYEAHSCLWHLILMPFAKLGFPVITMNIISWIMVSTAVYFMIFHSKWHFLVKATIIFSPTYIYFSPVISRCYSLIPIFLCLFSFLYPKRKDHPFGYANILGILAHTHMIMCGLVGMAALLFLLEYIRNWSKIYKKEFFVVLAIFILYFILLAIQIFPSLTNGCIFIANTTTNTSKLLDVLYSISNIFFHSSNSIFFIILLGIILLITNILIFLYNKKLFSIFLSFLIVFIGIHMFWPFSLLERMCILFVVMTTLNLYNKNGFMQLLLFILSICMMITHFTPIKFDFYHNYSDSKNVATYINENVEDHSLIFLLDSSRHVSAIPYIKKDLDYYNLKLNSFQTYITWNYKNAIPISYQNTISKLLELSKQYKKIYIMIAYQSEIYPTDISLVTTELLKKNKMTLIYTSTNNLSGEVFFLYQYQKEN